MPRGFIKYQILGDTQLIPRHYRNNENAQNDLYSGMSGLDPTADNGLRGAQ